MRVCCLIRRHPHYRRDAFEEGIKTFGAQLVDEVPRDLGPQDVLVIWNRYGANEGHAKRYEATGGRVIAVENGYIGHDDNEHRHYAMAISNHNGAGWWPVGEEERWKQQHITLESPRREGREIVILLQRGIGPHGIAQPKDFEQLARRKLQGCGYPVRVRAHPGQKIAEPLARDLRHAAAVVTWGSGAALKALAMGIPVFYSLPCWIGGMAGNCGFDVGTPLPPVNEEARRRVMHRIGWAQWNIEEIARGEPFRHLLRQPA